MQILAGFGVGFLAFVSIFSAAISERVWFKAVVSVIISALVAVLVFETWI